MQSIRENGISKKVIVVWLLVWLLGCAGRVIEENQEEIQTILKLGMTIAQIVSAMGGEPVRIIYPRSLEADRIMIYPGYKLWLKDGRLKQITIHYVENTAL